MTGVETRPPRTDLLVIEEDERRQKEFQVNLRKPVSNWKKALQQHSTFQTLSITESSILEDAPIPFDAAGGNVVAATPAPLRSVVDVMMQLSMELRSYPSHHSTTSTISKIEFSDCRVFELGMLCMALMNQPTTTTTTTSTKTAKTTTPTSPNLSLSFKSAIFDSRAVKALCCLLEDDSLKDLCLEHCTMDHQSARALKISLGKNRSLRSFHWCTPNNDDSQLELLLMKSIRNMVLINCCNLVKLHMSVPNDQSVWNIFRAATQRYPMASSLQRLQLIESHITHQVMEAVMMMCMMIDSFQDLCFDRCSFTDRSLKLLEQTLSKHKVLDKLAIEYGKVLGDGGQEEAIKRNFGNAQVHQLSLQGTHFDDDAFSLMVSVVQFNPLIQSLNVSEGLLLGDDDESFFAVTELIQEETHGLSELVMDGDDRDAEAIMEALQRNSTIQALTIRDEGITNFLPFAKGLTNMSNLRKFTFQCTDESEELPEDFFQALEQGMEQNTSLQSLEIRGVGVINDERAKRHLPKIRYYLAINRIKRNSLMAESVPSGLWAHVLSKTCNEADGIYYVLTGKPDIIVAFTPSRKRKKRNDDDDGEGE